MINIRCYTPTWLLKQLAVSDTESSTESLSSSTAIVISNLFEQHKRVELLYY